MFRKSRKIGFDLCNGTIRGTVVHYMERIVDPFAVERGHKGIKATRQIGCGVP